jgi:hypothetical protein
MAIIWITILEHTGRALAKNFGIVNPPVWRGLKSRSATGRLTLFATRDSRAKLVYCSRKSRKFQFRDSTTPR